MSLKNSIPKTGIIFLLLILALATNSVAEPYVDLETYVNTPDDTFEYELVKTTYKLFYTTYIFDLKSLEWHSHDVDPGRWNHWLVIVEPRLLGRYTQYFPFFSLVRTDKALLYLIRGDAEHENQPSDASAGAVKLALSTMSIVAELHGIPVGPIRFNDEEVTSAECDIWEIIDPDKYDEKCWPPRKEDSLQARSFDLALSTEDFSWALMYPMTKAVVRGMDVVQEFLQERNLGRPKVNGFVVTGHSKRGHITWLAAALDSRVVAIVPMSYDLLNIEAQIALQDASWPDRGEAQDPNEEFNLYERYKTEVGQRLIAQLDAYAYLDNLNIPILIQVGTGDTYSCSDAAGLYINALPSATTRIHYAPNTGHAISSNADILNGLEAFYRRIISGQTMPDFVWTEDEEGSYRITPGSQKPLSVKLWTATNPEGRDFRFGVAEEASQWTSTTLQPDASGQYPATVEKPATGFKAFYFELQYRDSANGPVYSFATPITMLGE